MVELVTHKFDENSSTDSKVWMREEIDVIEITKTPDKKSGVSFLTTLPRRLSFFSKSICFKGEKKDEHR